MKSVLEKVLNEYLVEKKKPAKGNPLYGYLARTECEDAFYRTRIIDSDQYIIKSSGGQGGWGTIPWIGVFDKNIGVTATKGFYIVYLFSADMNRVYLSLNQGWTFYKESFGRKKGKENIRKVTEMWKNRLLSVLGEFSFDDIDLAYRGSTTDLPKGYELGHICGKCYYANNLPSSEILMRDLQNLLAVFRELKGEMIDGSTKKTINYLISEYESGALLEENSKSRKASVIDEIIASEGVNTCLNIKSELPNVVIELAERKNSGVRKDYISKAVKQEKLGLVGELMVIEHEKKKLTNLCIDKEVEHISKTVGDSAGYDIKSYDEEEKEIHIEVKTTKGDINTPFYLTQRELEHCKGNIDNYQLYRVYNFNESTNTGDLYIIKGDITKEIALDPYVYVSKGRKQ